MNEIKIPIDTVKGDFKSFLDTEKNSRVFFSGRFGIGKTYFLNEFFNSNKDDFEVFHLYPVNYQISSNEDILELVKYDLLIELLKKNKEIFQEKEVKGIKDSTLLFYSWCKDRYTLNSTLQFLVSTPFSELAIDPSLSFLSKLGKPLKDLLEIDKEFQEFKNTYKAGEKGKVETYMQAIRDRAATETDFLSYLLKQKINTQKGIKKSVLILDDLDRVDPEHIFRILNVLSFYFENEHGNKFGFDVVIAVADLTNIKNIFYHRYGQNSDFSGYIDKYFTINPYYFDNKKAILDTIDEIVRKIKNEEPGLSRAIGDSGYIKIFLEHIFSRTIDAETVNLRELLKATKYQLSDFRKGSYREDSFGDNFQKIFDKAVKTAVISFSSIDNFIQNIELIKGLKLRREERMPYGKYVRTMIKGLSLRSQQKGDFYWNEYRISEDDNRDITVSAGGTLENLFYDLLIEYVRGKKYIKNSYSDYDE